MSLIAGSWGPVLSGGLVRLQPIDPRLARAMLAGAPDSDLVWEQGFPMAPVLGIARKIAAATEPLGPFLAYAIVRQADGRAIGDAGFHGPPSAEGELELGYAMVPAARRQGFAREAAELLIAWARSQPGVRAITARVEPGNTASERLLDHLGFVGEGEREGMQRFILRTPA
jgi:RimJ/RimL family protein N-acetyltransferase